MTKEEIKNLRELIGLMLDKCILEDSRTKVFKRLEEVCDLAIKALEQDYCCDAISREEVLKKQYRIDDSATLSTRDVVNVEDIKDLPPVISQPKAGRWISVTKRQPNKSGKYWCTFGGTNLTGSDYYTTESDAKETYEEPEEYVGWASQNVIAWMPLPEEPYKEERCG